MKTPDVESFINSLNLQAQKEYKADIAELKKRIWYRVMLEPKMTLRKSDITIIK